MKKTASFKMVVTPHKEKEQSEATPRRRGGNTRRNSSEDKTPRKQAYRGTATCRFITMLTPAHYDEIRKLSQSMLFARDGLFIKRAADKRPENLSVIFAAAKEVMPSKEFRQWRDQVLAAYRNKKDNADRYIYVVSRSVSRFTTLLCTYTAAGTTGTSWLTPLRWPRIRRRCTCTRPYRKLSTLQYSA